MNRTSGSRTSGSRTSGSRTSGNRTSGNRTFGSRTSGSRTSGSRTSGSRTSGSSSTSYTGYNSNYKTGIRAENRICRIYESKGWDVKQSAGSRGAADLVCKKGDKTHYVQCKTVTKPYNSPHISNKEKGRVKLTATKNNATAIVAKVGYDGRAKINYAKNDNKAKL
jgi:hypothetical protein